MDLIPRGIKIKNSIVKDRNMDKLFNKFNIQIISRVNSSSLQ